jgi:hypothetical protein
MVVIVMRMVANTHYTVQDGLRTYIRMCMMVKCTYVCVCIMVYARTYACA